MPAGAARAACAKIVIVALGQINPTIGDFDGNRRLVGRPRRGGAARRGLAGLPRAGARLSAQGPARAARVRRRRPRGLEALAPDAGRATPRRRARRLSRAAAGRPVRARPSPTRPRSSRTAASRPSCASRCCPPTTCSTRGAISSRRPRSPVDAVPRPALGVTICEDIWNDADFWPRRLYRADPSRSWSRRAPSHRQYLGVALHDARSGTCARACSRPRRAAGGGRCVFVNQVGGQDDLVFDGASLAFDAKGEVVARAAEHESELVVVDLDARAGRRLRRPTRPTSARRWARWCWARATTRAGAAFSARCSGCRAASIRRSPRPSPPTRSGRSNVLGVSMPSRYSSRGLAGTTPRRWRDNLGIGFDDDPDRADVRRATWTRARAARASRRATAGRRTSTEENLQARIRGAILMALSNRYGRLLLTTGNKSELASATARSTATWRAAWRSSATCRRRWSTGSRAT